MSGNLHSGEGFQQLDGGADLLFPMALGDGGLEELAYEGGKRQRHFQILGDWTD